MADTDVVQASLTPEEVGQVSSTAVETPPTEVEKAVDEVIPEKRPEVKITQEPKAKGEPVRFNDVFKSTVKAPAPSEMTFDEKAEYEKLKNEKYIEDHQKAFEHILSAFDNEEREVLQTQLDEILKEKENPDDDIFGKLSGVFTPAQTAYLTTAIAFLEKIDEVEKIRSKRLKKATEEAADKATKSAGVKKTLTEIADTQLPGDKELTPGEQRQQLKKIARGGNTLAAKKANTDLIKMALENEKII